MKSGRMCEKPFSVPICGKHVKVDLINIVSVVCWMRSATQILKAFPSKDAGHGDGSALSATALNF